MSNVKLIHINKNHSNFSRLVLTKQHTFRHVTNANSITLARRNRRQKKEKQFDSIYISICLVLILWHIVNVIQSRFHNSSI